MKAVFEKVPEDPASEITAFLHDEVDFGAPWHFHPECELTYILEGEGLRYVGNHIAPFAAGELVLLRGNLPHCWKNIQKAGRSKSLVIQWEESLIPSIIDLHKIMKCLDQASQGLIFSPSITESALVHIKALILEGDNHFIKLLEILHLLSKDEEAKQLSRVDYGKKMSLESQDRMGLIFNFISENFGRKISLKEITHLCHLSEPSFSRFFSSNFQKPFSSYLNEYRISQASRMLIESHDPIAQIAFSCGYESLSLFYTQFRKYKALSPRKYRKAYKLDFS
ncbi:MAG: AraC family transcriptional regulator [Bacteroidia bacterium]|nr:AraC family transcriptional regulator [Bacteroidia bacterium]